MAEVHIIRKLYLTSICFQIFLWFFRSGKKFFTAKLFYFLYIFLFSKVIGKVSTTTFFLAEQKNQYLPKFLPFISVDVCLPSQTLLSLAANSGSLFDKLSTRTNGKHLLITKPQILVILLFSVSWIFAVNELNAVGINQQLV